MIASDTFMLDVMLLIAKVFFDALGINIKNNQINKTMLYFYKIGHLVLASNKPAKNKLYWSAEDQSISELEFDDDTQVKTVREGQVFMPSKTNNTIQS